MSALGHRWFWQHSMTQHILNVLEDEAGWTSTALIADRLGCDWERCRRQMYRLRDKGLVEHRRVPLSTERAKGWGGRQVASYEWRVCA